MRALLLALTVSLLASAANADDPQLVIKDHKFQPERLEVPAGVKFKLMVRNNDPTAEEFESFQLNREKVVPPGKEIPVFLGPLDRGEYPFFGDFHQDTAKGVLVAK
ncbi:MAG: cupredoxin domain-containing protein [Alphaproteobacteria bacterium]|nr:cupredoxin domain-containing protein [Alphaproteobacteria bacterium]